MSFNAFDTFMTECRVAGRIGRETLQGMRRTGWMNIVIIVTMASILSILGVALLFLLDTGYFVKQVGSELEISAYVKDNHKATDITDALASTPHIRKISIITKQEALEDLKTAYEIPLEDNPLPDTIRVMADDATAIPAIAEKLESMDGVEHIQYPRKVLDKLTDIARGITFFGSIIGIFLFTLSMFIISNTIHLLIESKSREIEILRMMGIGDWYIRLPFIFQGGVYGLLGALVAFIPLAIANYYLVKFIESFQFQAEAFALTLVTGMIVLAGVAVGSFGSVMAVHKYLKI
jgi:cell division transport system permease protein